MYNNGTIKLVWYSENNSKIINSLMFSSLNEALKYSKNLSNFMIMKLMNNEEDFYTWEILEYGDYNKYNFGMLIKKYMLPVLIGSIVLYFIFKKNKKK